MANRKAALVGRTAFRVRVLIKGDRDERGTAPPITWLERDEQLLGLLGSGSRAWPHASVREHRGDVDYTFVMAAARFVRKARHLAWAFLLPASCTEDQGQDG